MEWTKPCRAQFEYLAKHNPQELFDTISSGVLPPGLLTFAAEACGDVESSAREKAKSILLSLIEHPSPLAREGAVYGLWYFMGDSEVQNVLKQLLEKDLSPGVRESVREAFLNVE